MTLKEELLKTAEARSVHIGLRVEPSLLDGIDSRCEEFSVSRSELAYIALTRLLDELKAEENGKRKRS